MARKFEGELPIEVEAESFHEASKIFDNIAKTVLELDKVKKVRSVMLLGEVVE